MAGRSLVSGPVITKINHIQLHFVTNVVGHNVCVFVCVYVCVCVCIALLFPHLPA